MLVFIIDGKLFLVGFSFGLLIIVVFGSVGVLDSYFMYVEMFFSEGIFVFVFDSFGVCNVVKMVVD